MAVLASTDFFTVAVLTWRAALAPIIVNSAVMHFFVPSSGAEICLATPVTVLEIFVGWSYRAAFRPLLRPRHELVSVQTDWSTGEQ